MSQRKVILVGGGVRSGKSDFALGIARRLGARRLFLATARPDDAEMQERIDLHQRTRGDDFRTVEEPLAVPEAMRRAGDAEVVVLDCVTLWLSNLLLEGMGPEAALRRIDDLAESLCLRSAHAVVVTNEVGLGLVPETPLGRLFRDLAGLAHKRLAAVADEVYFGVLGMMLRLKPGPVAPAAEVLS